MPRFDPFRGSEYRLTMHLSLRISWLAAGLGLAVACGSNGDSDTSSSTQATDSMSSEAGTEDAGTQGEGTSAANSTGATTGADATSSGETTGPPAPSCGGECLADVVAAAYSTCETDLGRDFPCDAPAGCDRAVARCDATRENCTFEGGDADAFVGAVTCILEGLRAGDAGRYTFDYTQDASSPDAGDEQDSVFSSDVHADGSAQALSSIDLGRNEILLSLYDIDVACVQDGLAAVDTPTDLMEALFIQNDIQLAFSDCRTLCLEAFEGFVDAPDDVPCL